ncbi:MAG: DNA cytosine methyltransferase [Planctomycetaceae bacterium]
MQTTLDPPLQLTDLFCGSLFSGAGGMDLGLERAGFKLKWQVEIDPFARRVLERHWPTVRRWDDVRTWPQPDTERVDLLCGGFPCTDISSAGAKAGIEGEFSGLWFEYARIIRKLRPRFVLVENVADLLVRGIDRVLGDLAKCGYHAGWRVFSSCEFGFPFMRRRLFLFACTDIDRESVGTIHEKVAGVSAASRADWDRAIRQVARNDGIDDGVSGGMDRRCHVIGNAVVPRIAEWIGRRIAAVS